MNNDPLSAFILRPLLFLSREGRLALQIAYPHHLAHWRNQSRSPMHKYLKPGITEKTKMIYIWMFHYSILSLEIIIWFLVLGDSRSQVHISMIRKSENGHALLKQMSENSRFFATISRYLWVDTPTAEATAARKKTLLLL